ncbi:MAG TPA: DUF6600 domain-containing protein [Terriglobales bacterium]|nr:DUF6600 domain-containing protein [Terriglobales bacterium]
MRTYRFRWATLLGVLGILALMGPQIASADDDADPPSRVARLNYTSGAVSFSPAGTDDWVTPEVNRPITIGDKLWTDKDSRAELGLGTAFIRLDSQTGFSFLNLDDQTTQIRITEGTINVRVKELENNEIFEVDTPNLAFTIQHPGSYAINVNENGDVTTINVRDGQGEVTGGGNTYSLQAGESDTFTGTDQIAENTGSLPADDDFDTWCADRDQGDDRSISARYVSNDVVGYQDLDNYGGWRSEPDYGYVWFPHTTIIGWAPYRYGHWVWIAPWGWTWVDDAPWGFAPFHYGRWVVVGGVWGWVPAPPRPRVVTGVYVRPVYAPALVAWVGGPHWGVGVATGGVAAGVAWFPLGPRDVYLPSYHVSQRYVENVNVSNTVVIKRTYVTNTYNNVYVNKNVNVTNIRYQNQAFSGAVTATSRTSFTSAQPVGRNMIRVNEREIASAPVAPMSPGFAPQQRSVLGPGGPARFTPPARVVSRQVVARTPPPAAAVPFNRQQQAIEANGGRPLSVSQQRNLQPANEQPRSNVRIAPEGRRVVPQNQTNPPTGSNSTGGTRRPYNDRPPVSRPPAATTTNPQIQQRQQQELEDLRQKQDQERQRVEQQQIQQRQQLEKQNADERKQEQVRERQQQELQKMEQKHDSDAQKLEQKQKKEVQKERKESKPPKEPKSSKPPSNHG